MISPSDIQRLTDLPIEGVAERLGLSVRRHISLCPFHEDKHPSLHFNREKNRYRCYVCGAHGRTIDLVMDFLHLSFSDACRWLADGTNIIVEEYQARVKKEPESHPVDIQSMLPLVAQPVLTDQARQFLFCERHLDPRVIQWCGISSTHTHLIIPYFSVDGCFVGIQWRYLGSDPNIPRFRFPKGSSCGIYNLQVLPLLKPGEPLFITEGCSDCWAMLSSGHKAIAIPSATLLKPKDIELLSTLSSKLSTEYHIYPDQDIPGERLFLQFRDLLPGIIRHQLPSDCKDFSEYYQKQHETWNLEPKASDRKWSQLGTKSVNCQTSTR